MSDKKVTLVTSAEGVVTATVEDRSVFQAVSDTIAAKFDDKTASVGFTSSVVDAALIYGGMLFAKYRQTGQMSWNPF